MKSPFEPFLKARGVAILDGALATELEARGADLNNPLWSAKALLETPDLIRSIHYNYYQVGADVATSASYQASFAGFAAQGISATKAKELIKLSVQLASDARDAFWTDTGKNELPRPIVAASVGCYGAHLHNGAEYRGDYGLSLLQLLDFHRPHFEVLAQSGADVIGCETVPCLLEAEAFVRLFEEFPDTPAWVSFSCKDQQHVSHGERLADCLNLVLNSPQVVAAGINCTAPKYVSDLLRTAAGIKQPLIVYPSSGEQWDPVKLEWLPKGNGPDIETCIQEWYVLGARILGGCCRTTPATIRHLAKALQ